MIIDRHVKEVVAQIEGSAVVEDDAVRELVSYLAMRCGAEKQTASSEFLEFHAYPLDADGYAVAFDPLEKEEEFRDIWNRTGIVVGKSIVSPSQCKMAINNIKKQFNAIASGQCDFNKPESWNHLPEDESGTSILSRGFFEIYHDDVLAQLRQAVRVYIHHVLIWQRADLWTSFDRLGVKLPHHNESRGLPLHVDQNPNVHPAFCTIQGVLALSDCPAERGTFLGVPGSKHVFDKYAKMAENKGEYIELNVQSDIGATLNKHAQPIPLRAGNLVSWDSRTTHANTENRSDKIRMIAYIAAGIAAEKNQDAVKARIHAFESGRGSNVRDALMHASKKPRYTNPDLMARVRQPENLTLLGKLLYGMERYEKIIDAPAP